LRGPIASSGPCRPPAGTRDPRLHLTEDETSGVRRNDVELPETSAEVGGHDRVAGAREVLGGDPFAALAEDASRVE